MSLYATGAVQSETASKYRHKDKVWQFQQSPKHFFFITNSAELMIYFRHQGISTCHLFIALVLFTVWVNGHTFREIVKMSGSLDMTESSSKCIQSPDLLWLFLLWYFIGLCQCYFKTSILSEVNVFIEIKLTYMNFI